VEEEREAIASSQPTSATSAHHIVSGIHGTVWNSSTAHVECWGEA
jgi:hypothetical protein